jgi:hypothetical protein
MTDTPSPESLRPGSLVGPWRIEGYAGRGSYGLVFRARLAAQPHAPPVALKVAVFPGDPRFMREATLLGMLQHLAVPRLLDQGCWHASTGAIHPYVVMEWIRGLPLYEWARHYPVSARQALLVVAQVADALALLHKADGLHRDIKGDNILVDSEGRAVLTDFGSGTWRGAPPLTESLMPPNTPEYRSPQAHRFYWRHWQTPEARYEATAADDLYALGVTAYRLVTRVYPPPGTSPEELKQRLQAPPARRLPALALNAHVGPELSALIERMLAEAPEARASSQEVAEEGMASARQSGAKADGPLFTVDRPTAVAHCVPARQVPVAHVEKPAVNAPGVAPARVRTDPPGLPAGMRSSLLSGLAVVTVLGIVCVSQAPRPAWLTDMHAEASDAGVALDGGTRGLGENALASRVDAQQVPLAAKVISEDLPKQPLPRQRRPPCRGDDVEVIHGACWIRLRGVKPPCGDDEYLWQGACYSPLLGSARIPTTDKPQE